MMMTKLNFCGDVWLPYGSTSRMPSWVTDGLVINLEGPITARGIPATGKICLATDITCFTNAFPKPPLAACLANNHIMDYGEEGFEDTIATLQASGVKYFGAGTEEDRCNNPLIMEIDNTVIALLGYVCTSTHPILAGPNRNGVAPIDIDRISEDVAAARSRGALRVIISLHWGMEEVGLPKPEDLKVVRALIDMGVDLIIGHHAHRLQPVLIEKGTHVFFGLGNAMFPNFEYRIDGRLYAWSHQRWWNRTTAIVTYSPKPDSVTWQVLRERKGVLVTLPSWFSKLTVWDCLPTPDHVHKYYRKYRNNKRIGHVRLAISRFIARPRWPSLKSIFYVATHLIRDTSGHK